MISLGKKFLYCANVGDSESFLFKTKEITELTRKHKPSDEEEEERIEEAGGEVNIGRVEGTLAVSRTFGDFDLKDLVKISDVNFYVNRVL